MRKLMNKKSRGFLMRIIIILVSSSIFMSLSFIIQRSIFETNRENSLTIYGEWQGAYFDISADQQQMIENNQLIAQSATMNIMGEVFADERAIGSIGFIEEPLIDMGRLTLKEGEWPTKENDVVIESYILDKLHIAYEVGQRINLNIRLNDRDEINAEFVLSGILKSYSANWQSDGELVSIFTKGNVFDSTVDTHIFMQCQAGYEDVLDSLIKHKLCVKNTAAAFPFDIHEQGNQSYLYLLLITFILSVSMIFIAYFLFLLKERVNLMTLRALGMSLNQLSLQLFKASILVCTLSVLLNYLICMAVIGCLNIIFKRLTASGIILSYALSDWFIVSAVLFVISIAGFIFASIFMRKMTLTGNFSIQSNVNKRHRKYRGKYLSAFYLGMRHFNNNRKAAYLQCISITLLLLSTFYLSYNYQKEQNSVNFYQDIPDYVLDGRNSSLMFPRQQVINPLLLEDLNYLEGIDKIYSYYETDSMNDDYSFEWEGYQASPILNEISFMQRESGKVIGQIVIIDPIKNPELFNLVLNDIDEGELDIEAFNKGESALMYLPDIVVPKVWSNRKGSSFIYYQGEVIKDQLQLIHEDTLSVGSMIHVKRKDFDNSIPVTGLIRQYNDSRVFNMFYDVYCLIVSPAFIPQLNGVNEISIFIKSNVDGELLDKQLSIIASEYPGVSFTNYREEANLREVNLQSKCFLYITLFACMISIVIMIQVFISYNKSEIASANIDILKKLGANKKTCRIYYLSGEVMILLSSILMANVLFVLTVAYEMNSLNEHLEIKYTLSEMFSNYALPLHIGLMMFVGIVLFMISIAFSNQHINNHT